MNGMSKHIMLNQADLQWGGAPPALPAGAKLTVLQGDPSKEAPFVVRLEFPADYKIPAHWLRLLRMLLYYRELSIWEPETSLMKQMQRL